MAKEELLLMLGRSARLEVVAYDPSAQQPLPFAVGAEGEERAA